MRRVAALLAVLGLGCASASSAAASSVEKPRPASSRLWSLDGRTAVVTGGSKGLGRAIVEELMAQGCTVLTCARDVAPLADLVGEGGSEGGGGGRGCCIAIEADVSTAAGREALVSEAGMGLGLTLSLTVTVAVAVTLTLSLKLTRRSGASGRAGWGCS